MESISYLPEEPAKNWTVRGSNRCRYTRFLFFPKGSDRLWGPSSFVLIVYRVFVTGIQRLGKEVGHSPQSSAGAKKECSYNFSPPICLYGVDIYLHLFFCHNFGIPLTLRWLMSYIYGAPILDVSRSHTTTQHSR